MLHAADAPSAARDMVRGDWSSLLHVAVPPNSDSHPLDTSRALLGAFAVGVQRIHAPEMFARVETSTAQPSEIDDVISSYHHTVGLVRTPPGNMGGYVLVNRDVGEVLSVTFWNSEEDRTLAESEFTASPHRGRVSFYSVAMQESLRTS